MFTFRESFRRQTEKQLSVLKSLKPSYKNSELTQIEVLFPQNRMNDLFRAKLKEIVSL